MQRASTPLPDFELPTQFAVRDSEVELLRMRVAELEAQRDMQAEKAGALDVEVWKCARSGGGGYADAHIVDVRCVSFCYSFSFVAFNVQIRALASEHRLNNLRHTLRHTYS